MTIDALTPGELLSLRIYKRLESRPDTFWANSYEFRVLAGESSNAGATATRALAEAVVAFEQQFHLSDVLFDRAVVSSFLEDGQPYNPLTFVSIPFAAKRGGVPPGTEPVNLQTCLMVRREVDFGRAGRALYRRCLEEADVHAPTGTAALTILAQNKFSQSVGETFDELRVSLASEGFEMVLAKSAVFGPGVQVRAVTNMLPGGVTIKKLNNRYFDRAPRA